jgi:predicted RNA-binding protein with EMAP domain
MTHDTSNDPRILVARRACALLKKSVQQKSGVKQSVPKEKLAEMASTADSAVMSLMYSYQDPAALASSDAMVQLTGTTKKLNDALAPVLSAGGAPPLLKANLEWCLRVLSGLPDRMAKRGSTLASGVDLVVVQVRNVVRKESLWLALVSNRKREFRVVTNLSGIETGDVLAVAFLPPREVGGEISEAMFLGSEKRPEAPGTPLTEDQVDPREAASILHEEIAKR